MKSLKESLSNHSCSAYAKIENKKIAKPVIKVRIIMTN